MLWRRRAWRARAIAWAGRRLRERGLAITGEAEQFHVRPWSTVIRLPTERGTVFFKATWPPQRFEAGLTAAIAKWAPDDVGRTLAIDAKRGWLLLEDAGPRLRQTITKDRDIRHWHRVLPQYAELQIAMSSHIRQALKLGTPDRRATALARQYARLLDEPFLLRVGLKEGLTKAQDIKLRELSPQVRRGPRRSASCPTRSSTMICTTAKSFFETAITASSTGAMRVFRIRSCR